MTTTVGFNPKRIVEGRTNPLPNVSGSLSELKRLSVVKVYLKPNLNEEDTLYMLKATGKRYINLHSKEGYMVSNGGFKPDGQEGRSYLPVYRMCEVTAKLELVSIGDEIK